MESSVTLRVPLQEILDRETNDEQSIVDSPCGQIAKK